MGRSAAATAQVQEDWNLFVRFMRGIGAAGVLILLVVIPVSATLSWHRIDLGVRVLLDDAWAMWFVMAVAFDGLSLVHGSELRCRTARPLRRVTSPLVAAMADGVKAFAAMYASVWVEPEPLSPLAPVPVVRVLPEAGEPGTAVDVPVCAASILDAQAQLEAQAADGSDVASSTGPRIRLLGGFGLDGWGNRAGDDARSCWRMGGQRLLGLLVLHRRGMSRDALLEALFPDRNVKCSLALLRQAVRAARVLLHPVATIERRGDRYTISVDGVRVDLWDFENAVRQAHEAPAGSAARLRALRTAAAAYAGDLLDSVTWTWCEASEVTAHRQELHTAAMAVFEELAHVCERDGDVVGASAALDQALRLEPTAEHVVRRVMHLHAERGCYEAARLTFEALRDRLKEDGMRPQAQTVEMARRLLERGQAGGLE